MPECKAARERNDMGRQDVFAYPVELSPEGHDRSLATKADVVSAVRPKIAPARIQSDDASARVHHMSVAVERQNPEPLLTKSNPSIRLLPSPRGSTMRGSLPNTPIGLPSSAKAIIFP